MQEHFVSIDDIFVQDFRGTCDYCGVCCTHVSINSTLPDGTIFSKPAGEKCTNLTQDNRCRVWGDEAKQPSVCRTIAPNNSLCRFDLRDKPDGKMLHINYLQTLELMTSS